MEDPQFPYSIYYFKIELDFKQGMRCDAPDARLGALVPRGRLRGAVPLIFDAPSRGVTLAQIRALSARASALCASEAWYRKDGARLNPEELTTGDIVRWVVLPATAPPRDCSFAELVAPVPPTRATWLVCASLRQPWAEVVAAIAQHAADRRLPPSTGYYLRALSLNLHARGFDDAQQDSALPPPAERAMRGLLSQLHGSICVVDMRGAALSRAWWAHEAHAALTRTSPSAPTDLYAAEPISHALATARVSRGLAAGAGTLITAVGLVDGDAPIDGPCGSPMRASARERRERQFPGNGLVRAALDLRIDELRASREADERFVRSALGANGLVTVRAWLLAKLLARGPTAPRHTPAIHSAQPSTTGVRWTDVLLDTLGLGWGLRCVGGEPPLVATRAARLRGLADALSASALRDLFAVRDTPSADDARSLARALPPTLARLRLWGMHPEVLAGAERLLRAAREPLNGRPALAVLELAACGVDARTGARLARALSAGGAALQSLSLRRNALGDAGAEAIARALLGGAHHALLDLDVSTNGLGDAGGESVARLLRARDTPSAPRSLRNLSLADNALGPGAGIALGAALEHNLALRTLALGWNRISNGGADALARGLCAADGGRGAALESLDVTCNGVGDSGALALARALSSGGAKLHVLVLQRNAIGHAGCVALAEALAANPHSSLRALSLWSNYVDDKGAVALGAMLRRNTTLTDLNLASNGVGEVGGAALRDALRHNATLASLDLSSNPLGRATTRQLADAWARLSRPQASSESTLRLGAAPSLDIELAEHFPRAGSY